MGSLRPGPGRAAHGPARWLVALCLALAVAPIAGASGAGAPAPEADGAREVVESLHRALLEVGRQDSGLDYAARFERLAPVITRAFDLPLMARLSLGASWKELGEAERERFVEVFSRLAIANYAARFRSLGGEHFETVEVEPAARGMVLVRTRLVRPDDAPVRLDYRVRESPDGWRIVDVVLDGAVSELALRRAEYASVVGREGFDALVRALEQQIAERAREAAEGSALRHAPGSLRAG